MNHAYKDPLALLSEEELRAAPEPVAEVPSTFDRNWHEKFHYDLYDWNDPEFQLQNRGKYAYVPIRLTKGYFMMVSPQDYKRMTTFTDGSPKSWFAKIDYDKEGNITGIYARRSRHGNEPKTVYAHRELLYRLEASGLVDHQNAWGLDNRRGTVKNPVNLKYVSERENQHNAVGTRTKNHGLPQGVERRGKRFGGIRSKRLNRNKAVVFRSKRTWATPEPAARWYQNQLKRLHPKRTVWAHIPATVKPPIFPPLFWSEMSESSAKMREKSRVQIEVPF